MEQLVVESYCVVAANVFWIASTGMTVAYAWIPNPGFSIIDDLMNKHGFKLKGTGPICFHIGDETFFQLLWYIETSFYAMLLDLG